MRQLGVNNDLIDLNQSFLMDKKDEIVIDSHINLKKKVKTGIPKKSLVLSILFLIYISGIFDAVKKQLPKIISLSFINDLKFLAYRNSIQKLVASLEKTKKTVIK